MADSKKYEYEDFFASDIGEKGAAAIQQIIDKAELLQRGLIASAKELQAVLKTTPTNLKDVENINKASEKTKLVTDGIIESKTILEKLNKKLAITTDEEVKAKIRFQRANAEQNRIIKSQIILQEEAAGSINALRAELSLVTEQWRKTGDASQRDINITGSLAQKKRILTEQLKTLEEATGDHRRSVGHYEKAVLKAGKGIFGLTELLGGLGRILGFNTGAIEVASNAARELVGSSRALKDVIEAARIATSANTTATGINTTATEGATAAQRIYTLVVGQSVGAMKVFRIALAATGIGLVLFALVEAAKLMGLFGEETESAADKASALKKELQEQAEAGSISNETLQEYRKQAGAAALAETRLEVALQGTKKTAEDLRFEEKQLSEQRERNVDALNRSISATKRKKDLELELLQVLGTPARMLQEKELKNIDEEIILRERELKSINKLTNLNKGQILIRQTGILTEIENLKLQKEIIINNDKFTGSINLTKEAEEKAAKALNQRNRELHEQAEALNRLKIIQLKLNKISGDDVSRSDREVKEILFRNKIIHLSRMELLDDEAAITEQKFKNGKISEQQFIDDLKRIKKQKEAIEGLSLAFDTIEKGIAEGLDKRAEKRQEAINKEQSQNEKAISRQEELAAKGLTNQLAFEEKKKAELAAKLAREKKKEQQREEAQELAKVFIDYLQQYIKEGNTASASGKALAATFVAKGISKAIAGGLYEGTESVTEKDAAFTINRDKDNLLVPLHPSERVLGVEDSARLKGMTNDDLVKAGELYRMNNLSGDISKRQQVKDAMISILNRRILELTAVVKNKKETNINWDAHGARVEEVVENGIKKIYKHITTGKSRI